MELHPQQRVAEGPALCAAQGLPGSAGDGELLLAADLAGGEVQHQPPTRSFLGPKQL